MMMMSGNLDVGQLVVFTHCLAPPLPLPPTPAPTPHGATGRENKDGGADNHGNRSSSSTAAPLITCVKLQEEKL